MLGHFKVAVSKACDDVCGKKRRRSKGNTWWWNEEYKEAISRKNYAHKVMCRNSSEEKRYKSMKKVLQKRPHRIETVN